jgi:hypothetical protein
MKRLRRRMYISSRTEPQVAIFWVVDEKLVIDSTPLSRAEAYGDFKIHAGDHYAVWSRLQQARAVPAEMTYEEPPRGRITYNMKTRRFTLLADKCILKNKAMIRTILLQSNLPRKTELDSDLHYRCPRCLYGTYAEDHDD